MTIFLDTSVLVPLFLGDHQHHSASIAVFARATQAEAFSAAHCLAEVYATLTRMPGRDRVGPDEALLFIASLRERLQIIALTADEYSTALERAAELGVMGRTIHDSLIAACALKSGADAIYTWNLRHFLQFGPEVQSRLRTP